MRFLNLFLIALLLVASVSALSILSASKIDFTQNAGNPVGYWIITGVENGGNDQVVWQGNDNGKLSGDSCDFADGTTGKCSTANPVTLVTDMSNNQVVFDLVQQQIIYSYEYRKSVFGIDYSTNVEKCFSSGADMVKHTGTTFEYECYERILVGIPFEMVGSGEDRYNLNVKMDSGGKSESMLLSYNNKQGTTPDGWLNIQVQTSGVSGRSRPTASRWVWQRVNLNPYTMGTTNFATYKTEQSRLAQKFGCWVETERCQIYFPTTTPEATFDSELVSYQTFILNNWRYDTYPTQEAGIEIKNNKFIVNIQESKPLINPIFTLKASSTFLGVIRNIGEPEIISVDGGKTFSSGTGQIFTAKVRNKGAYDGSFQASLTCSSGFDNEQSQTFTLKTGEQRDINFRFDGTTANKLTGTCTLSFCNSENKCVQKSASVTVVAPAQCAPEGAKQCGVNSILQCVNRNDVLVLESIEACSVTCEVRDGTPTCVTESGEEEEGEKLGCSAILGFIPNLSKGCIRFWTPLIWTLTILGGLAALYAVKIMLDKTKKSKKSKQFNWIPAAIFGIGAGILIYFYWWVILIVLAILLIVKMVMMR